MFSSVNDVIGGIATLICIPLDIQCFYIIHIKNCQFFDKTGTSQGILNSKFRGIPLTLAYVLMD